MRLIGQELSCPFAPTVRQQVVQQPKADLGKPRGKAFRHGLEENTDATEPVKVLRGSPLGFRRASPGARLRASRSLQLMGTCSRLMSEQCSPMAQPELPASANLFATAVGTALPQGLTLKSKVALIGEFLR